MDEIRDAIKKFEECNEQELKVLTEWSNLSQEILSKRLTDMSFQRALLLAIEEIAANLAGLRRSTGPTLTRP